MGIISFCLLVVYLVITIKSIKYKKFFFRSSTLNNFKWICISLILTPLLRSTANPNPGTCALNKIPRHLIKRSPSLWEGKQGTTKRYYSTSLRRETIVERKDNPKLELNPFWLTGFADGESCFYVGVRKSKKVSIGWRVTVSFSINLHEKDRAVLEFISDYLGVGKIYKSRDKLVQLRIESIEEVGVVISHFQKYPLLTDKRADFILFREVYNIIISKEHLTESGLRKIVARKASMNNGLSLALTSVFADVIPVDRPLVLDKKIKDPYWLAGFTAAEGCFLASVQKSTTKTGFSVKLFVIISQHERDKELLASFMDYLGCGRIYKNKDVFEYRVSKFSDIEDKIIPFFKNYPLKGVKSSDFDDWCLVVEIMKDKKHLTLEGLEQIKQIQARMNKQRNQSIASKLTD